jgi:hypothetical protein
MMPDQVTRADFAECLGEQFQIECGGQAIAAELAMVTGHGSKSAEDGRHSKRESFSLLFHAPKQWRYPQRTYRLSNPKIGPLDIFLVPLGPDDQGMRLEAVFNFT